MATHIKKKKYTLFRPVINSRHPSHSRLRRELPLLPFRSTIRLGSTTPCLPGRVECNTVQAVRNSASKLLMKQCFTRAGVKTAPWWTYSNIGFIRNGTERIVTTNNNLPYPIISKSLYGSRGVGNIKHDTQAQLESWIRGKDLSGFIFESYVGNMSREYRVHISGNECFYACRKLLRNDAPENSWQKHADICTFIVEENPSFKKPNNWNAIIEDCVRAKHALGLDIDAFDLMIQGSIDGVERTNPEWIIVESCSAPSLQSVGIQKYLTQIPIVLKQKYERQRTISIMQKIRKRSFSSTSKV